MTFYPINKPTEPGWYWFRISSQLAQPFPLKVTIEEGELWGHSDMPPSPGTPFKARVEKFVGQWYGPKIEMPNPHARAVNVNDGSHTQSIDPSNLCTGISVGEPIVPRRFRWRERIKARGMAGKVTGVGVCWIEGNILNYECWPDPNKKPLESCPSHLEIIEWLDPEPEKAKEKPPKRFQCTYLGAKTWGVCTGEFCYVKVPKSNSFAAMMLEDIQRDVKSFWWLD